jgi:hypothetical protein
MQLTETQGDISAGGLCTATDGFGLERQCGIVSRPSLCQRNDVVF